jgi:hypothetical protein
MSKSIINIGALPNDGTGDSLRTGATKVNNNFGELYDVLGDGNNLSVGVGKTIIGISSSTYNVGIGSTIPTSKLTVIGDLSATSYKLGTTEVISSSGQLKNISSLDVTTTATIESAIQAAPNTFTDLRITGISTFVNGPVLVGSATSTGTASQPLQVSGGAYVSGNVGIGTTNPTHSLTIGGTTTNHILATGSDVRIRLNRPDATGTNAFDFQTAGTFDWAFGSVSAGSSDLIYRSRNNGSQIDALTLKYLGGNVGINSSTPNTTFDVGGSAYVSGNVGLGITNPTSRLFVVGNGYFTGVSSVGSGTTITDGHVEVTGIVTANGYVAGSGTNNIPAFQFSTGTLLTGNGTLGAVEYDGQSYYATGVTTGGRGFIPVTNLFRLESNRQILAATGQPGVATNFFDPGLIPLVGNGEYEIDFDLYFTKGTTGVTTFTLSTPTAPASINAIVTTTPVTGVSTNTPASPQMVTAVGSALTSTGLSLTLNNATHYAKISVFLENGSVNTNTLTLNIMNNNSTCIPLRGSRWKSTLLSRNAGIGVTQ